MTNYNTADVLIKFFSQYKEHTQLTFLPSWDIQPSTQLANTIVVPADIVTDRKWKDIQLTFYIKESQGTAMQAKAAITKLLVDNFGGFTHQLFKYGEDGCNPTDVYIDFRLGELTPQAFEGENYVFTADSKICISKKLNLKGNVWQTL